MNAYLRPVLACLRRLGYGIVLTAQPLFVGLSPTALAQFEYLEATSDDSDRSKQSKQTGAIVDTRTRPDLTSSGRELEEVQDPVINSFYRHVVRPPGWEIEIGGTLLKPVEADFDFRADLGIGLVAGVRKGFYGGHIVLSQSLEYDIYLSGVNRIAFGGLLKSPFIRLEGYGGVKYRVLELNPFDNFINERESLHSTIAVVGLDISLPGLKNYMTGRIEYWPGSKRFLLIGINVKLSI